MNEERIKEIQGSEEHANWRAACAVFFDLKDAAGKLQTSALHRQAAVADRQKAAAYQAMIRKFPDIAGS